MTKKKTPKDECTWQFSIFYCFEKLISNTGGVVILYCVVCRATLIIQMHAIYTHQSRCSFLRRVRGNFRWNDALSRNFSPFESYEELQIEWIRHDKWGNKRLKLEFSRNLSLTSSHFERVFKIGFRLTSLLLRRMVVTDGWQSIRARRQLFETRSH